MAKLGGRNRPLSKRSPTFAFVTGPATRSRSTLDRRGYPQLGECYQRTCEIRFRRTEPTKRCLPDLGALTGSAYRRLVMAKAAVLAVIGAVGWWHQRRSMLALRAGSLRCFARLAAVEVLLFGAVVGLASVVAYGSTRSCACRGDGHR
jgi:hypothetical protein